jgi:hypothetical protein
MSASDDVVRYSFYATGYFHAFVWRRDHPTEICRIRPIANYGNSKVKGIVAADGYTTINTLGSGFYEPTGVAVDGSGNVPVADYGNNPVKKLIP